MRHQNNPGLFVASDSELAAFAKAAEPYFSADHARLSDSSGAVGADETNDNELRKPEEDVLRLALRFYLMFANADRLKQSLTSDEFHALSLVDDLLFRALLRKQVCVF